MPGTFACQRELQSPGRGLRVDRVGSQRLDVRPGGNPRQALAAVSAEGAGLPSAPWRGQGRGMSIASAGPEARSLSERRAAARERLAAGGNLWLASAGDGHGPHMIPVSYVWTGERIVTATFGRSRTVGNVRSCPSVRAAIGSTADVLMIDAIASVAGASDIGSEVADAYAQASGVPRSTPGFVYLQLAPQRMQVWRGRQEFAGRTVMLDGHWLDEPVD
jgi:hypothetical protein